jgi:hypothetical protein
MSSSPAPSQLAAVRINEIAYAHALHCLFQAEGTFPAPPDPESVHAWFEAWLPLEVSGILALSFLLCILPGCLGGCDSVRGEGWP